MGRTWEKERLIWKINGLRKGSINKRKDKNKGRIRNQSQGKRNYQ